MDKTALYLDINDNENNSATIIATISPTNATSKNVTWTSSNKDVATVADGVVTAVAEGTATITATSNNGKKATTTVTVLNKLEENTVAVIGTKQYDSLQNALAAVGDDNVVIELIKDARLEYGARDAYGNESTQKVTIKGNGKELTLHQTDGDWSSIGLTNGNATFAFEDVNVVKTTVGGNGAWNNHAINFDSKTELTNITFDNAIALSAGAKLDGVTITEANEYYGIWIGANGQTVTIEDTTVTANTNGGRGIKISDQYIESPQLVKLSVSNSTFNTAKKSAIIVGSTAGADITITNLNIENVEEDKINAVWVDEDWADYQDEVTVTGGTKILEGAVVMLGNTGYKTLKEALDAVGDGNVVIELMKDATLEYGAREAYGSASTDKVTIKGNGKTLTLHQTDGDWSSIGLTNGNATFAFEDVNVVKTTVGGNGAWNNHAINFDSKTELTNITFDNAIALSAGAKLDGVTITEANEYYGIWIRANGQEVTIEDTRVTANTDGGRGIKISDQYIEAPQLVKLSVSDSTFDTAKKSAIIVGSTAGADITITNLNIENVEEDKINAVWVDEDWADYQDEVTVTGGTKILEGAVGQ